MLAGRSSGAGEADRGQGPARLIETRPATIDDAPAVSALLTANTSARGGTLFGDWPVDAVEKWIASGSPVVLATDGPRLVGALFTSERSQASSPPVDAMLRAWPGSADAYIYGPVCVDQAARGLGVLEAMYEQAVARLPGREAILFINKKNPRSLQAHLRLGMTEVAEFKLGEQAFVVLSGTGRASSAAR